MSASRVRNIYGNQSTLSAAHATFVCRLITNIVAMASNLSPHLHSDECNVLIEALHQCHADHRVGRLFGRCNDFDHVMQKCLKKELEDKRAANKLKKDRKKKLPTPDDDD